jgi:hypothetical protein
LFSYAHAQEIRSADIETPRGEGERLIAYFLNGASPDLRVNGQNTPVDFTVPCSATKERLIKEIRIFGQCSSLRFGRFFCKNSGLTTGMLVTIRSEGVVTTFPDLQVTEDFTNKFAFGGHDGLRVDNQGSQNLFMTSTLFDPHVLLKKCGTPPNDEIKITVRDNLTGNQGGSLDEFAAMASGFERDP